MSAPTSELPSLELHFRRPSFWGGPFATGAFAIVAAAVGLGFGVGLFAPSASGPSASMKRVLFLGCGVLAAGGLSLLAWLHARSKTRAVTPLRAYSTHLVAPRRAGSDRTQRIDYADILSLDLAGRDHRAILFLATSTQLLAYRLNSFIESDPFERLNKTVREHLLRRPDGERLLAEMARRDAFGQSAVNFRPRVTFALLVMLVAAFIATFIPSLLPGAEDSPFALVRYGANVPTLVRQGQWFRLFSANFLHANLLHIYMNGMGLLVLGAQIERLLGPWRFVLIYLLSAIGGSAASALAAHGALSVGASTAIFGLLGSMAIINWRFRRELPAGFRQPLRWWAFILGINAALPLLVRQIDAAAHVGGFFAGVAVTCLVILGIGRIQRGRETPFFLKLVTSLVTLVFCGALVQAVAHAFEPPARDEMAMERAFVEDGSKEAEMLNAIAWKYATSETATAPQLDLARRAAEQAHALMPDEGAIKDTLATVYYRLGDFERAVALEAEVFSETDDDVFFSQLARFLDARQRARGSNAGLEPNANEGLALRAEPGSGGALILSVRDALPEGARVWVLVKHGTELQGGLLLRLGPSPAGKEHRVDAAAADLEAMSGALPQIVLIERGCPDCSAGTLQAEYRRLDPSIAKLP
jgi:rhomboid protease GluP